MHHSSLPGLLGGIASSVLVAWLFRQIKTTVPPAAGNLRTLRYHVGYAVVGWAGLIFFLGCAVGASFTGDLRILWFCLPVFGFFTILSSVLIVMHWRCVLTYDADTIRYSPLWGQPFTFTWPDVGEVRFSSLAQWWRLRLRDGRNARVSTYMHGAVEFMQTVARRTNLRLPVARMPNGRTLILGRGNGV